MHKHQHYLLILFNSSNKLENCFFLLRETFGSKKVKVDVTMELYDDVEVCELADVELLRKL